MKTVVWIASLATAVTLAGSAQAGANLITDGTPITDGSSPNQAGGWNIYYPGINGLVNRSYAGGRRPDLVG